MKKGYIVVVVAMFALGFFGVKQFLMYPEIERIKTGESVSLVAGQISIVAKGNAENRKLLAALEVQKGQYADAVKSREEASKLLSTDIAGLRLVGGEVVASGTGVEIKIGQSIALPQMVDLVNTLKNIGADAIVVSGKRLVLGSYFTENEGRLYLNGEALPEELVVEAVGEAGLLYDSLLRVGGFKEALNQAGINDVTITKKEKLAVPTSTYKLGSVYAKESK